jgi:hypothetical protein
LRPCLHMDHRMERGTGRVKCGLCHEVIGVCCPVCGGEGCPDCGYWGWGLYPADQPVPQPRPKPKPKPKPRTYGRTPRLDRLGLLLGRCWCGKRPVEVTPAMVRAGLTNSCGRAGCERPGS